MPRNSFYDGNAGDDVTIDNSVAQAKTSETNAANSATAAASSASGAATSATNAAASYDSFDDRYLGAKASNPSTDNDGDTLLDGALYWNTTTNQMFVYDLGATTWDILKPTTSEQTNINTVAGISSNVTTVAGISANTTTVAGIASDVTAVAGKATEVGRLGTAAAVADMAILGTTDVVADLNTLATADVVADLNTLGTADVVADLNTLGTADVVSDMNTLGTADVVSDMNTLGTSANVTNMNTLAGISANVTTVAGISSNVTTVAGKATEIGRLGTADAVADMNILGTADVVSDMNTLGTADIVSDMNTLAVADVISDMNTLATADVVADLNTLGTADVVSDMNTLGTAANVTAMDTCASNITGINSFADRYRIAASAPTTSKDEGDLYFNTTDNTLNHYNGSSWSPIISYSAGTGISIASGVISASSIALTTVQTAATQVAMLALTTQEGDVVVRTDENKTYVKNAGTAGTMADFTLLETPTDAVSSVNGQTGTVVINTATTSANGLMSSGDKTKLNGIETGATADQTNAEIKTAYEANADTNEFSDAEQTKLSGIATSANNYSLPTASASTLGGIKVGTNLSIASGVLSSTDTNTTYTSSDFTHDDLTGFVANEHIDWTADQGATNVHSGNYTNTTYSVGDGGLTTNDFTDADHTKLNGIATSANNYSHPTGAGDKHIPTGGATGQFLKYSASGTAVWAADNDTTYSVGDGGLTTKDFTTTLKSKLDGIAASANNYTHPATHTISEVSGLQTALDAKETAGDAVAMAIALG